MGDFLPGEHTDAEIRIVMLIDIFAPDVSDPLNDFLILEWNPLRRVKGKFIHSAVSLYLIPKLSNH